MDKEATESPKNADKTGVPRQTLYKTVPLDTKGAVTDAIDAKLDGPVRDPFELIRRLADSEHVEQVFVRHAFRYFLGRNETLADGPALVAAHQAYRTSGGSMKALIASLLSSAMFPRRTLLTSISAGAGGLAFAPLFDKLAAMEAGTYKTPKRVVFVLFGNGFHEPGSLPLEIPAPGLQGTTTRTLPLEKMTLPYDIEPFTPWKDRLAIVHGLRAGLVLPDHGAGFAALSGVNGGAGDDKRRNVIAESIDCAVARKLPGIYPLLNLGIDPGQPATKAVRCSSAWGPGQPLAAQCRPELAYESLFGGIGATRNDFAIRRDLLDFLRDDVKHLRSELRGTELDQLDYQVAALESLAKREATLGGMFTQGKLAKTAPTASATTRPTRS